MKTAGLFVCTLAYCWIVGICSTMSVDTHASDDHARAPRVKLTFNENGEAAAPRGYRSWVHAAIAWEPIGSVSFLNGKENPTPEIYNTYVEPAAYRTFMQTGKWPEGSLIVKEFSVANIDPTNCDGPPGYLCKKWFGKGIFQHEYTGIGVMLKDTKRYPNEAGGWAYFSYGHQQPPYMKFSAVRERAACAQCHIDHAGVSKDYVFTDTPGLSRNSDAARNNLTAAFAE